MEKSKTYFKSCEIILWLKVEIIFPKHKND